MVYTKHFTVHGFDSLNKCDQYIQNADKTLYDSESNMNHLDHLFRYIASDNKTMMKQLVSSHGLVDVGTAYEEFKFTKLSHAIRRGSHLKFNEETGRFDTPTLTDLEKNNAVLAHHLIQSFSPDDNLTPEQIHEIGRKTMLEFTGGEYEFVIATHTDRQHIHNHIIVNSTNMLDGKSMPWKIPVMKNGMQRDKTKEEFEKVSDKVASKYGAKIIEKSPRNTHQKYTKWQTESLFKTRIKSRLDFLIQHSSSVPDFLEKAEALHLQVDFSKKWATYRLMDEPQIKNTRGRNLDKGDPEKYNLHQIELAVTQNEGTFTIEEVVAGYQETINRSENDFDFQLVVENWQISHSTEKGYYLNVDFGYGERGQVFIGGHKVDKLEEGNLNLFVKQGEYFYLMSEKDASYNRYITGASLIRQLRRYNGQVPLRKEPIMSSIQEVVEAINFLAEHDVTDGRQINLLEDKLEKAFIEARETMDQLDEKLIELHQVSKLLIEVETTEEEEEIQTKLSHLLPGVDVSELKHDELIEEIETIGLSRKLLSDKLDETIKEIEQVQLIQASTQLENEKGNQLSK